MVRPDKNLLLAQLNAADFGQVVPWLSLIQLNALEVLHDLQATMGIPAMQASPEPRTYVKPVQLDLLAA